MFVTLQKLALGSLRLNSVRFNSQQEVQTNGRFSSKYKYKNGWISSDYDAQRNWSGDVPTMLPKSAFLFRFRANGVQFRAGYIQIKCRNVNIMSVTSFIFFVNFTLTLRLCTVSLPRPRPHFTDVQPTAGGRFWPTVRVEQPCITSWNRKLFAIIDLFCAVLIYF